jgi:hypothetical protein
MTSSALSEVLVTLADAQELSERLPPLSPDHETFTLVITRMRGLHRDITRVRVRGRAALVVNHARASVAQARDELARVECTGIDAE